MFNIFLTHLFDKHLGCSHFLAIVNRAERTQTCKHLYGIESFGVVWLWHMAVLFLAF